MLAHVRVLKARTLAGGRRYGGRKKIPKIFNCPNCGNQTVVVELDKSESTAWVSCGSCELEWETETKQYEEKIDVYNRFVDALLEGEM